MSVSGIGAAHEWHNECTSCPEFAFAHTLEEQVEVEAFPVAANVEAILVARSGVTNLNEVTVVLGCTVTPVNHAVAVLVFEFDVTRTIHEA